MDIIISVVTIIIVRTFIVFIALCKDSLSYNHNCYNLMY